MTTMGPVVAVLSSHSTFRQGATSLKTTILTYGLISGALCSLMMLATLPFESRIGFDKSELLGYTLLVLAFLLVFFGIRSYRENIGQGVITFSKALTIGLSITLIVCVFYVVTWEILYFTVLHDFMDKYAAYMLEKAKAGGATAAALQAQAQQLKAYKELYENPLFNAAITFLEPLPVGLLVTLISAVALRRKTQRELLHPPLPASN
jgi:hypothetical protein